MIYLDNAATTPISKEVLEEMIPYMTTSYGNAGSRHRLGRDAKKAVDKARLRVSEFLNCRPDQVVFTSGGTEGNNSVFKMLQPYLEKCGKKHIVVSAAEHSSVINAVEQMRIKHGFDIQYLPVDGSGTVDVESVRDAITEDTGLVSVMFINNEIGGVNDVQNISEICHDRGVLFHTDAVQAAGCTSIDTGIIQCDFMTISSHKINGPKGVGALYIKDSSVVTPMICGGGSQEHGLRGGTENVPGIVGFGRACEIMKRSLSDGETRGASDVKNRFIKSLHDSIIAIDSQLQVHLNGNILLSPSRILSLRFDGIDAETLLLALDASGVCVSAGSACNSFESKPSRVLIAAGLTEDQARSSIRISFPNDITNTDIACSAEIISTCAKTIKEELCSG